MIVSIRKDVSMLISIIAGKTGSIFLFILYVLLGYRIVLLEEEDLFDDPLNTNQLESSKFKKMVQLTLLYFVTILLMTQITFFIAHKPPTYPLSKPPFFKIGATSNAAIFLLPLIRFLLNKNEDYITLDVRKLIKYIFVATLLFCIGLHSYSIYKYRESHYVKPATEVKIDRDTRKIKEQERNYEILSEEIVETENILSVEGNQERRFPYKRHQIIVFTPFYEYDDFEYISKKIIEEKDLQEEMVLFGFLDDPRDVEKFFATTAFATYAEGGSEQFMGEGLPYNLSINLKSQRFVGKDQELDVFYKVLEYLYDDVPIISSDEIVGEENLNFNYDEEQELEKAYQKVAEDLGMEKEQVQEIYLFIRNAKLY